ncbi:MULTISPECIES: hypothetical protein [Kitasatospora]|uniref:hypothetical protein n=1 Tax=Kitasatospora TaxID=2063 RepID=UPI0031D805BA
MLQRQLGHPEWPLEGLVVGRADGSPLRSQWVLDQVRKRSAELDLPNTGLHAPRHTVATIMIAQHHRPSRPDAS